MSDQRNHSKRSKIDAQDVAGSRQQHSDRRRRILKGAVGTAPLVMTLANRPSWGAACWSGIQSGNMSKPNDECGGGLSPGYYKNHPPNSGGPGWPAGINPGDISNFSGADMPKLDKNGEAKNSKLFGDSEAGCFDSSVTLVRDLFPSASHIVDKNGPNEGMPVGDLTIMQALWQCPGSFTFHAIAAYFNALHAAAGAFPFPYVFRPDQVYDIVDAIYATGVYIDVSGEYDAESMKCVFDATYHLDPDHDLSLSDCH